MIFGTGRALVIPGAQVYGAKHGGVNTIVNCHFTADDGTLITSYLWDDPLDIRPGSNQWYQWNSTRLCKIFSNKASADSSYGIGGLMDSGVSDCTITATFNTGQSTSTSNFVELVFRALDAVTKKPYWQANFYRSLNRINLTEVNPTGIIRAYIDATWIENTDYTISVVLSGQNITLSVSGGATGSVSYSSDVGQTQTYHGFDFVRSLVVTNYASCDNFLVTVP